MKALKLKMLLGAALLLTAGIAPLAATTGRDVPTELDGITSATPTNPEKKDDTSKQKKQKKAKKQKKSKKQDKQSCCGKKKADGEKQTCGQNGQGCCQGNAKQSCCQ